MVMKSAATAFTKTLAAPVRSLLLLLLLAGVSNNFHSNSNSNSNFNFNTIQPAGAATSSPSEEPFTACSELAAECGQDVDCRVCLTAGLSEQGCNGAEDAENPTCETYGALACCAFEGESASCLENTLWFEFLECALDSFGCTLDDVECIDADADAGATTTGNGAAAGGGGGQRRRVTAAPVVAAVVAVVAAAAAAGGGGALVDPLLGAAGL